VISEKAKGERRKAKGVRIEAMMLGRWEAAVLVAQSRKVKI